MNENPTTTPTQTEKPNCAADVFVERGVFAPCKNKAVHGRKFCASHQRAMTRQSGPYSLKWLEGLNCFAVLGPADKHCARFDRSMKDMAIVHRDAMNEAFAAGVASTQNTGATP